MSDTLQDEPTSFGDVPNDAFLPLVRSAYATLHIEFITLAIQLVLCVYGFSHYRSGKASAVKASRRPYLILSFVILGLFLVPTVTDSVFFANMTINNASGSFALGFEVVSGAWWTMLGTACNVVVILVGDALLVYRCYFIWSERRQVIIVPCVMFIASLVMGILATVASDLPDSVLIANYKAFFSAWITLSVTLNAMTTALIAGKLIYERRRLSKVLANDHLVKYTTATAILIESALPLSVVGLAAAIVINLTEDVGVNTVVPSLWFCLSALCSQLIIFRACSDTKPWNLLWFDASQINSHT